MILGDMRIIASLLALSATCSFATLHALDNSYTNALTDRYLDLRFSTSLLAPLSNANAASTRWQQESEPSYGFLGGAYAGRVPWSGIGLQIGAELGRTYRNGRGDARTYPFAGFASLRQTELRIVPALVLRPRLDAQYDLRSDFFQMEIAPYIGIGAGKLSDKNSSASAKSLLGGLRTDYVFTFDPGVEFILNIGYETGSAQFKVNGSNRSYRFNGFTGGLGLGYRL